MSEHTAVVESQRTGGESFVVQRYSRRHAVSFDGGATVALSASPHAVDPEVLFVTALANCHRLWFLSIAASGLAAHLLA